jgi:hypothetical protein
MSNQCEGKTKSGVRCKNKTRNTSKRCHLHAEAPSALPVVDPVSVPDPVPVLSSVLPPVSEPIVKKKPVVSEGKKELPEQGSGKSDKTDCCVCLDEMPGADKLDCGHPLCRKCVGSLRNDKCPMCRRDISARHITAKMKQKMRQKFQADRLARQTQASQNYIATFVNYQ